MRLHQAASASLAIILSTHHCNAQSLQSNLPESPQILSDTSNVCTSSQGRSSICEVELDVPSSCIDATSSSDCPIVFFFHGAGGTNDWFARTSNVHTKNVIGVYPQGEDGWNTGPKDGNLCTWDDYTCTSDPDEPAFIAAIIAELRTLGANGNIYLIGNSNGAALSHKLASNAGSELPIKGIITKVTQLLASPPRSGPGTLNYNQPGSSGSGLPISVLNLMGTNDMLIPYEGGYSSVFGTAGEGTFELMSALESMATWASHNGCSKVPPIETTGIVYGTNTDPNGQATFYEYQGCPEGIIVEHYALQGAGHSFGSGASLDGISIDYELAYQFIARVEALDGGGGGGPGPAPSTLAPVSPSTQAPITSPVCQDDSNWHGKFSVDHTCTWVGDASANRCGAESSDGTLASDACKQTCGTCDNFSANPPTDVPVTSAPITSAPSSLAPTPPTNGSCVDDINWHGKFSTDHTCVWIGEAPLNRCGFESSDGTLASVACRQTCGTCDTTTFTNPPTGAPILSTLAPTFNPSKIPTASCIHAMDD